MAPRGWVYQNMLFYSRMMRTWQHYDVRAQRVDPKEMDQVSQTIEQMFRPHPYKMLAAIAVPNMARAAQTVTREQTYANEAAVVCALERYRHKNGEYPETLDQLVPQFMQKVPHDMVNGKPLVYHRAPEGRFVLYSVGWDGQDDAGVPAKTEWDKKKSSWHEEKGDWVWMYPQPSTNSPSH